MLRLAVWTVGRATAVALFAAGALSAQTHYTIDLAEAAAGWLTVSLDAPCPGKACEFQMPVWSATYQVRDFSQYIARLESPDAKSIRKVAPSRWRVEGPASGRVHLRYRVLTDRSGPFGAYADSEQVTLNLAQVLAFPVAARGEACTLEFLNKPEQLEEALALPHTPGGYAAPSFDRLVDTPVHLAQFDETTFQIEGKSIRIVASGAPGGLSLSSLESTAKRLFEAAHRLMGELPFDTYTIVYVFSEEDGGGMEFRNGTLIFAPVDCRNCGLPALTAHEIFHLWNVKRIRPASMEPVDYARSNPTPSLWFAEGVTSTYAQYLLLMARQQSSSEFLTHLERLINEYESRQASNTQSAEESSIDAWLERYPAYGRADRSVSYYLKGELIGHLLDLALRERSANRHSLDDVLRRLNEDYAKRGRFFEDSAALERICEELTGADFGPIFDDLVRTAKPIAWDDYLLAAGYRLSSSETERADLGMTLSSPPGEGVLVSAIWPGGPAERSGLRAEDRVLRVDGRRVTGGAYEVQRRLERMLDRPVELLVDRRGLQRVVSFMPALAHDQTYRIVEVENPTREQMALRRGWFERTVQDRDRSSDSE
ncbi:MAG: PDZ domain-containing protein [Bryobacterales bacterium]